MSQLKYKKNSQVHTVGVSSVDGQTGDAHIAVVSSTEPDYGTLWINPDETGNGIDATPTAGSENLVTSGGVKSYVDSHDGMLGNAIGMRGWNQLIRKDLYPSSTDSGVTFTNNNNNGSWTISGTSTASSASYKMLAANATVAGHKYLVWGGVNNLKMWHNGTPNERHEYPFIISVTAQGSIYLRVEGGATVNETIYPQIFDLTALFGSGNEPSTVAEFRTLFPADYYPYCSGSWADLLWTNPNPTSQFPPSGSSPIQLDLSGYKAIRVNARIKTSASNEVSVISADAYGAIICIDSGGDLLCTRGFSFNSSGVSFYNNIKYGLVTSGASTDNAYAIPYQIYGIR